MRHACCEVCVALRNSKKEKRSMDVFKHHRNLNGNLWFVLSHLLDPCSLWSQTHSKLSQKIPKIPDN
jgi:hypothetical protein